MEVLIRAGIAQVGESVNKRSISTNAMRAAVDEGLFEGVPCHIKHSVPGVPDAGRIRLGYWRRVKYDEKLELAIGYMYTKLWDPFFERMGFSWDGLGSGVYRYGRQHVTTIDKVHSVDMVFDPAQQRCRVLDIIVLDDSPMRGRRVFVSLMTEG